MLAQGDKVIAKKADADYCETFAGRVGIVVATWRERGEVVAKVWFGNDEYHTFFVAGLRRVREVPNA